MPPDPHPTASERIPRKRQARLDDNGEPAGVPALKKMKSVEKNVAKKNLPAKTRPEKKNNSSAPPKKTSSIEIPAARGSDVTKNTNATVVTNPPEPELQVIETTDDDDNNVEEVVPEVPEEDAEAQLGGYSSVFK